MPGKVLLVSVFALLYSWVLSAQDPYIPTLQKGTLVTFEAPLGMQVYVYNYIHITCDSIIVNDNKYYEVKQDGSDSWGHFSDKKLYMREDTFTRKVYYLDLDNEEEVMFLDYNLEIGDTLAYYDQDYYDIYGYGFPNATIITGIDSAWYFGALRKIYTYEAADIFLIEGIGRNFYGAMPPDYDDGRYCYPISLEEVSCINATLTTFQKESVGIFPNPFVDQLRVDFTASDMQYIGAQIQIMSIDGQLVYEGVISSKVSRINTLHLPDGIMVLTIRSGEKVFTTRLIHMNR
jgi:hypothetical protein